MPHYQTTAPDHGEAEYVQLAPGIAAPPWIELTAEDHNGYDLRIKVEAVPGTEGKVGRFECASVLITRRPDGPAIASGQLREVPVSYLVRIAAALWWQTVDINQETGEVSFADKRPTAQEVAKVRAAGPRAPETQEFVARVYRLALILNEPPAAAVERALGIPRSTVNTWIAAARKGGTLSPSEGRGKAVG